MMTVEVKMNGEVIASASATNETAEGDFSDYVVTAAENAYKELGIPDFFDGWRIETHDRRQSCWALVEKIAAASRLFQSEAMEPKE